MFEKVNPHRIFNRYKEDSDSSDKNIVILWQEDSYCSERR